MTRNRRIAALAAVVILTAGNAWLYRYRPPVAVEEMMLTGMSAPAWKLKELDGREVSSDQLKGKVVIVDFWATWCAPCIEEIPHYNELQKKYGRAGLVIVGISVDHIKPERVKKFAQEKTMGYTVVVEGDDAAEDFGGFAYLPTTFLINRNGRIVHQKSGPFPPEEYKKIVRWVLKQ